MTKHRREEQLSFRPMVRADQPLLEGWLAEPHVAEWWDDASETFEGIDANHGTATTDDDAVFPWIMEIEGRPIGWVQWYRVVADPQWWPGLEIPDHAVGIDIAIGDPAFVDQGHGRRLLLEFIHHVLRAQVPDSTEVWIDPDPQNMRAVKAYAGAGFVDTGINLPDPEHEGHVRRLMKLRWAGPTFH